MKKQLWEKLTNVKHIYYIANHHGLTIIEGPSDDKYACVRVFLKIEEAEEYGRYLITKGIFKGKEKLNIYKISLENLFLMNEEFEALAEAEFDAPLRVVLNQKNKKEDKYDRDVIFDSLQTKN